MKTVKNWIMVDENGVVVDFIESYQDEELGFQVFDGEIPEDLDVKTHLLADGVLVKIMEA